MKYLPHTPADRAAMLQAIGVDSVDALFADIPAEIAAPELNLPPPLSELELMAWMEGRAAENSAAELVCFLGAGAYDHYVPAVVDELAGRGEFYTSYTPYQAEISQGVLQAIFEYQTMICQLTGLDVSNASMYDGATALWEAILMAERATKRTGQVVLDGALHPLYRAVVRSYARRVETKVVEVPPRGHRLDVEAVAEALDEQTSALAVQNPNFFGIVDDYTRAGELAHQAGALFIVVANPIALALLKTPQEMGADLCVGEGQPLGVPLQFGGPYFGFLAARQEHIRRMPGRIVGETVDARGERGYVLTLQAREQHIRRHRATSNICTNQALMALRGTIYLATLGREGLRELAELNVRKANYLRTQIAALDGFRVAAEEPIFNEFVVATEMDVPTLLAHLREKGFLGGYPLSRDYPDRADSFLVCCTEKRTKEEMDRFVEALAGAANGGG